MSLALVDTAINAVPHESDHFTVLPLYTPHMDTHDFDSQQQTVIAWSDRFLGHDTGDHVEHPSRAMAIYERLSHSGLLANRPEMYVQSVSTALLECVHDRRYLEALERFSQRGGGWIDSDTYVGSDSLEVAKLAAGAASGVVRQIVSERARRGFSLGRPPGHHATRARAMGFCHYNSIAIAAETALEAGIERVAIVDWDVHHGNGTQDIYYERSDVLFVSIHQYPFYPGSGAVRERGQGAGDGYTINLPLGARAGDETYLEVFDDIIAPALRAYEPEMLLVSAGFDAHVRDPLGDMRVTDHGFAQLAERAVLIAEELCGGRIAAVLEGGYDVDALARSVEAVIRVFDGATPEVATAALDASRS
jgi:acetoin utilization deacetylase AcuC-like enzyme